MSKRAKVTVKQLIKRDGSKCHYCEITLSKPKNGSHVPDERTIDHVVPRAYGGSTEVDNLVLACYACNHARGDLDYQTFYLHVKASLKEGEVCRLLPKHIRKGKDRMVHKTDMIDVRPFKE